MAASALGTRVWISAASALGTRAPAVYLSHNPFIYSSCCPFSIKIKTKSPGSLSPCLSVHQSKSKAMAQAPYLRASVFINPNQKPWPCLRVSLPQCSSIQIKSHGPASVSPCLSVRQSKSKAMALPPCLRASVFIIKQKGHRLRHGLCFILDIMGMQN